MSFITRFAPSPTGLLHLGHAYSALLAYDMAKARGGQFKLRIDDLDQTRARPEWETRIKQDLTWLGIHWSNPDFRQSDHLETYQEALAKLWKQGLLYPCTCSRKDIQTALGAPQEDAPQHGPDGLVYPGTCRPPADTRPTGPLPKNTVLRLHMQRAVLQASALFDVTGRAHFPELSEHAEPPQNRFHFTKDDLTQKAGDIVLARKDIGASYHLAVVIDDALQKITHVVRGEDLLPATPIHCLLRALLGTDNLIYFHHPLIRDTNGKRLAKRDAARAIATFRTEGATAQDIRTLVGLA